MKEIENSFASNICRCTGYRPIADAFKSFATDIDIRLKMKLQDIEDVGFFKPCGALCQNMCQHKCVTTNEITDQDWCILEKDNNKMIVIDCGNHKWYKPYNLTDVFNVINTNKDYKFIAGNTGQGVYHVIEYPKTIIDIFYVAELKGHLLDVNLILGAGMPLSEMMNLFLEVSASNDGFSYLKQFYEHMDLVAHIPVRNIGTIGGNLYMKYTNNDFQSDIFLLFEAVGAMITIAEAPKKEKTVTLLEFLEIDMRGKIIKNIKLPPLSEYCYFKSYKIMPRSQNAHAVVNAAFLFKFKQNSNLLEKATLVFGSISAKFNHASKTEALLEDKDPYNNKTLKSALKTLYKEISPEDMPPEPSAAYRKMLAVALFYKAILYLCPDEKLNKRFKSGGEAIKRHISNGTQSFDTDKTVWPLNKPVPKLEAQVQCSGEAVFANDLPTEKGELFGSFVTADNRPGSIISGFDIEEALKIPGVIAFYSAKDIPGDNSFTPTNVPLILANEEILCSRVVKYYGEPCGIIVADREKTANKAAKVNVIVRRVGGGYGGKITRSCQIACAAALVAHLQGKICRFILPLETSMMIIGKRLPTSCNFEVGVNKEGEIQYLKNKFYQDNGCAPNETISPITVNHFRNCYDTRRWYIEANSVHTDTPSNTWCRAPSSTEGLAMIENIIERIAYNMGLDPLQVRLINMAKENNPIPEILEQIKKDSNYDERLIEIKKFNTDNRWRKRAMSLIPMTYDLFYLSPYNALVSIYHADGSVSITHGGTEMGQGVNTKVAQVCGYMFGIPLEKISIKPSSSFTSPNSMATGASIGSECVSFATMKACEIILERLKPVREKMDKPVWEKIVKEAFNDGIDLQASYTFSMKDGVKPYDIYGAVVLEVEVDILTGNHDVRRVDLLEDTGRSLSPEIDIGQIEGAFVMGLGYWTSEKNMYDADSGKLLTNRTWTYKPPGIKDIPADFRVYFRRNARNPYGVLQSKATGEPALCMAVVLTHALREAVRAARLEAGYEDQWIEIGNPCTVENIFMSLGHKLEHFKLK
ncbi:unnamed protein product [Diatraea saccharalis]|uniref:FAD-binding PCMH-type domain-containing protein n=1 Tax=Diatraea saccharalis TaxID=40085 RepID=A0A9N9WE40_9NEOP|nr:unnamed protein product [Diatraea saccharalis]